MFSVDRNHVVHSNPSLYYVQATAGYFDAAGTRILTGKSVAANAGAVGNCAVSDALARTFFPHQNAVGERVYFSTMDQPDGTNLDPKNACRVVAVVDDAKFVSLRSPAPAMLYDIEDPAVATKFYDPSGILVVRGQSAALAAEAVKAVVRQTMPQGAGIKVQTLQQVINQDLSRERMLVSLSGTFALLALLLTALGLYGLLMRGVTLRTRELGIRMALGAGRGSILLDISRRTIAEIVLGLACGLALTWMTQSAVRKLLAEPQAGIFAGAAVSGAIVLLIAVAAAVVPAVRAMRIDPMRALRAE